MVYSPKPPCPSLLTTLVVLVALSLGACSDLTGPDGPESLDGTDLSAAAAPTEEAASARPGHAVVNRQLAEVRRLTAPFHRLEAAMDAGWNIQLTGCLETEAGGMGFHYGNGAYLGDGVANHLQPEALLYEPQRNGRFRLVAVEYVVPFDTSEPPPFPAPVLFEQTFHVTPGVGYTLHAWIWRHNPSGMFADWNPNVSCEHAP